MAAEADVIDHESVLDRAWSAPGNTAIELPPADVNRVLRERYEGDGDIRLTRTMLWDMEVRKASAPDRFIPTVVRPGSAERFPGVRIGAVESFTRVSDQRLWLEPAVYGTVVEHVRVDHHRQSVIFIGVGRFEAPDGRTFVAGTGQPLFHVEHAVAGTEDDPLNLWRIVHLTDAVDPVSVALFGELGRDPYLRVFVEVYIREILGRRLERRPAGAGDPVR
ncbi:hypothetical protein [Pseudonocardia sp. GCM10023141]|uniref:hypothetical protein n=1 Tax=Pseudonocardia sp. GCM10023141 TaxID=3252653 RepID=UPI00361812A9